MGRYSLMMALSSTNLRAKEKAMYMTTLCLIAMLSERAKSRFICVQSSLPGEELEFNQQAEKIVYESWRSYFQNNPHELQQGA
jgi:hypothetical protein